MNNTVTSRIVAVPLILALAGCATTRQDEDQATAAVITTEASSVAEEEVGPWTRYGLPAPGSERTGVTVSLDEPKVTGLHNLDGLTDKSEQQIIAAAVDLFTIAYWDMAQWPTNARPNQYRAYMDPRNNRDYNADLRKKRTAFGFQGNKNRTYDLTVSDIRIDAVQDYVHDGMKSAEPAAHLRITWQMDYIYLPKNGSKGKAPRPARYTHPVYTEAAFADIAGNDQIKLIWWKSKIPPPKRTPLPPK